MSVQSYSEWFRNGRVILNGFGGELDNELDNDFVITYEMSAYL